MMPAQGLTLADSDDWGRVHRLDQLNRKKPAKLLGYQALTLIKGASRFWPVFSCISGTGKTHKYFYGCIAAEPKELYIVPGAWHVDLYDCVNLTPWDKLEAFLKQSLRQASPSN
jgi:hypothetical protein